jgi:hypothetical protein
MKIPLDVVGPVIGFATLPVSTAVAILTLSIAIRLRAGARAAASVKTLKALDLGVGQCNARQLR